MGSGDAQGKLGHPPCLPVLFNKGPSPLRWVGSRAWLSTGLVEEGQKCQWVSYGWAWLLGVAGPELAD